MVSRSSIGLLVLSLLVFCLIASCGSDDTVGADPYQTLAGGDKTVWKNQTTVTVDQTQIVLTVNLKFTSLKTYSRSQQGLASGEIIDTYTELESGNYAASETEIAFTPTEPTGTAAYAVQWQTVAGSGDLELTYSDGKVVIFTYEPRTGNEYSS